MLDKYLQCTVYLRFRFDKNGNIVAKSGKSDMQKVKDGLLSLVKANYPPALFCYAQEFRLDEEEIRNLYYRSAELGYPRAFSEIGQLYLSYLSGNILNEAPLYKFPKGLSEASVLANLVKQARANDPQAISYICTYLDNTVNALRAISQKSDRKRITLFQYEKLLKLAKVAKAISQDKLINDKIDNLIKLGEQKGVDLNKVNALAKEAVNYISTGYKNSFYKQQTTSKKTIPTPPISKTPKPRR